MKRTIFELTPQRSIREAFVEASSFLDGMRVMEPQRNAQLLLEHVLGLSGTSYYMALAEPFPADRRHALEEAINRKARGVPAQYIIGEQEFYGRPFEVTPAVLIPRPETELLVEAVLKHGQELTPRSNDRLQAIDIGTGSGAIAITLALQSKGWDLHASDISPDALEVAARNAKQLNADVEFRQGNLLEPFAGMAPDILVSNPPYIPAEDIEGLQPEVRDYEPRTALDGGPDGLNPYRIMMAQLPLLTAPPRLIAFELGMGQAEDVAELLRSAGHWEEIVTVPDLAGIDRHVLGISR
ncbi:peptide chain release factor N(5)-glutamine methyltransferase [Paenibacillus lautus]|uniref:peptide chain release factor N(5)-glutamine methyltransferase n=1 Tax=Paenibacillus TaxID=44249 RepID=UPI002DB6270E|nr:peptide chain release factor N(5)-glutamine methyltransferase [Paenibacillus lautus]MEC0253670.1 peptide chain release factor N(5)-glutamine methyltransferase [Paenibacillus lautus]MEC0310033.1 peptide chain release factor N(5)-glutamine methyltransferase [Paenibacillus lautus]